MVSAEYSPMANKGRLNSARDNILNMRDVFNIPTVEEAVNYVYEYDKWLETVWWYYPIGNGKGGKNDNDVMDTIISFNNNDHRENKKYYWFEIISDRGTKRRATQLERGKTADTDTARSSHHNCNFSICFTIRNRLFVGINFMKVKHREYMF